MSSKSLPAFCPTSPLSPAIASFSLTGSSAPKISPLKHMSKGHFHNIISETSEQQTIALQGVNSFVFFVVGNFRVYTAVRKGTVWSYGFSFSNISSAASSLLIFLQFGFEELYFWFSSIVFFHVNFTTRIHGTINCFRICIVSETLWAFISSQNRQLNRMNPNHSHVCRSFSHRSQFQIVAKCSFSCNIVPFFSELSSSASKRKKGGSLRERTYIWNFFRKGFLP